MVAPETLNCRGELPFWQTPSPAPRIEQTSAWCRSWGEVRDLLPADLSTRIPRPASSLSFPCAARGSTFLAHKLRLDPIRSSRTWARASVSSPLLFCIAVPLIKASEVSSPGKPVPGITRFVEFENAASRSARTRIRMHFCFLFRVIPLHPCHSRCGQPARQHTPAMRRGRLPKRKFSHAGQLRNH